MIPIRLDPSVPRLEDPSQQLELTHWQPQDMRTSKLTRCLESLRDLTVAFRPVAEVEPGINVDKRLLKQSITPLYNLATGLRDLFNELQSNCHQELKEEEKEAVAYHFEVFSQTVPTDKTSPLKIARDKIAVHLDKDTQTPGYREFWDKFDLPTMADWVIGCIRMFTIFLQPDLYHWKRDGNQLGRDTVMRFDGREITIGIVEDQPREILGIKVTRSPKEAIERELRELVGLVRVKCPDAGNGPGSPYKAE